MKTVIEMAKEAGGTEMQAFDYGARPDRFIMTHESIERLVELVRADERNSWPAEMEAMERQVNILTDALAEQPANTLPFGVGGGLVAIKTLLSRDPCVHANTAIQMIDAILAEQPAPAAQEEPCGWQFFQDGKWHNGMETDGHRAITKAVGVPIRDVYPSPQAQPAQPLTDEQIKDVAASCMWWVREQDILDDAIELARAIEAAHGIKENQS